MTTVEDFRRAESQNYMPSEEELGNSLYDMDQISQHYSRNHDVEEAEEEEEEDKGSSGTSNDKEGDGNAKKTKVTLFDPAIAHLRAKVVFDFLKVWALLGSLIIASFSIYWGSVYDRTGHQKNLRMLVVIEDDAFTSVYGANNASNITTVGDGIYQLINSTYRSKGDWHVVNGTEDIIKYFNWDSYGNVTDAVLTKVHHRDFWSSIQVFPNATLDQLDFYNGELDEQPTVAQMLYETGRDPTNMNSFVVGTLDDIVQSFQQAVWPHQLISNLMDKVSDSAKLELLGSSSAGMITPYFELIDYRPFDDYTLIAPIQVGLIYLIIVSFFLFNFFAETHKVLLPHVGIKSYLLYRLGANHLTYIILALFVSAVSAIYQIDFTKTFGKAGFVVFWMTNYLTMAAVGGANENMGMLIFAHNPPFLSFWLISFVILNVSPSYSPMALTSHFYRYGYAFPIHNANEIFKVIFFNLWKGNLGLNYGILVIWIVINSLLLPFILRHVGKTMAAKAKKAAMQAQQAQK